MYSCECSTSSVMWCNYYYHSLVYVYKRWLANSPSTRVQKGNVRVGNCNHKYICLNPNMDSSKYSTFKKLCQARNAQKLHALLPPPPPTRKTRDHYYALLINCIKILPIIMFYYQRGRVIIYTAIMKSAVSHVLTSGQLLQ